jgi:hypothetical protein
VAYEIEELNGEAYEGRENCENHLDIIMILNLPQDQIEMKNWWSHLFAKIRVHLEANLLQFFHNIVNIVNNLRFTCIQYNDVCQCTYAAHIIQFL